MKDSMARLTHSQFMLYVEQIRAGKSHKEAMEYLSLIHI